MLHTHLVIVIKNGSASCHKSNTNYETFLCLSLSVVISGLMVRFHHVCAYSKQQKLLTIVSHFANENVAHC